MNRSSNSPISDELLSAYIDGLVTPEEKAQIEAAIVADPGLAWELESLRRTVDLVRNLPPLPLPRSFVLAEEQVADVLAERRARRPESVAARPAQRPAARDGAQGRSFWRDLFAFFNSGNLWLRNAAAVAALFLVVALVSSPSGTVVLQSAAAPATAESAVAETALRTAEPVASAAQDPSLPVQQAAAEKAAPDAQEASAVTSASEPVAPAAAEAAAPAFQAQAESVPMESSAPGPSMRAAPGIAASGAGGPLESGPMAMQAVPADAAPASEFPPPEVGVASMPREVSPEFSAKSSAEPEIAAAPAAESMAEQPAAEESIAPEAVQEESPAQEAAMAEQSTPVQEPVQQPVAGGWSGWRILQVTLGGFVLLLGIMWLRSR